MESDSNAISKQGSKEELDQNGSHRRGRAREESRRADAGDPGID